MIKFVISGPFLNAESAHTQWASEPAAPEIQDLLRRIAELERKLDDERARVEDLCRQLPPVPPPVPVAAPVLPPEPVELEPLVAAAPPDEPAATTIAAPAPPRLSTAARTPPPKVRGLRRMIGALRHL